MVANTKKMIDYATCKTRFFGETRDTTLYFFYIDGLWDESKRTLEEALVKYPKSEYTWRRIYCNETKEW